MKKLYEEGLYYFSHLSSLQILNVWNWEVYERDLVAFSKNYPAKPRNKIRCNSSIYRYM
jgi:hypothetical protein